MKNSVWAMKRFTCGSDTFLMALLLAGAVGTASTANAAAKVWVGSTAGAAFGTAANWSPSAFVTADTPTFGVAGTAGTTLTNDMAALTVGLMTFSALAPAYTINGNAITLGGNITAQTTAGAQTINLPMTLSATRTVTTTATGLITLGGDIGESVAGSGLTKGGAGTLTLSGSNTFSGALTIGGGTGSILSVDREANLGAGTGVLINGNTTLKTTAGFATSKNLTIGSGTVGGTLNVSSGTLTLNGNFLSGSTAGATVSGAGILELKGTGNTFAAGKYLLMNASGSLSLGNANALNGTH